MREVVMAVWYVAAVGVGSIALTIGTVYLIVKGIGRMVKGFKRRLGF